MFDPEAKTKPEEDGGEAVWKDFTQEVSMHGIKYATSKTFARARRVIWLVFILCAIGYFTYASYTFLDVFVKKKLTTNIKVKKADSLQFPTVTICNHNNWRQSKMIEASYLLGTPHLFTAMSDLYGSDEPLPPPPGKYNWSDPLFEVIANLTVNSTEKFLKDAAHPLNGSVEGCDIFGRHYSCKEVLKVVSTNGGYCYEFNSNGTLNATAAGKLGGVRFLLHAHVADYSTGPRSYSEGFSLTFHNWFEVPLVAELSVNLEPGTQASVMLHKTETKRYPPPADEGRSDCWDTATKENPLSYYEHYSYSACHMECITKYVVDKCGCRDILQPPVNNSTMCTIKEMLYCSTPALRQFPSDKDGLKACDCKDPCHDDEYIPKISTSKFPSTNYITEMHLGHDIVEWLRANSILVEIFYGKMSYQLLEEDVRYTAFDMIAAVGGTLGLAIGASILTICEFVEFGALAISHHFRKWRGKPPRGSLVKVMPAANENEKGLYY